jgi:hypothetical protein
MINLVVKENKSPEVIARIKRIVITITSLILVIYIVVAGGMTGWTTWVSMRQKQTSAESTALTQQVSSMFDTEVAVRNLADRANMVEDYLKSRGNASEAANLVIKDGFKVIAWEYAANMAETVGVSATSTAQLKEYADYMESNYNKVQTSKIEWTPENGWTGTFIIFERKKT